MSCEGAGGAYVMRNRVLVLEPGRAIGWEPAQFNGDGELESGGWRWRSDLAERDGGTDVPLTYDWSRVPAAVRELSAECRSSAPNSSIRRWQHSNRRPAAVRK